MKRRDLFSLVLAAAVLTGISGTVLAQGIELPVGKWWKRPKVVETLKLQTDQQQRLDEIFAKHRREFIDLKAEFERRQVDLEELLSAKDSDPKRVAAASDALEQARGRLGKARTMMILEMKGVLTEVQWQRIQEGRERWKAERAEEWRNRRTAPNRQRPAGPPEE